MLPPLSVVHAALLLYVFICARCDDIDDIIIYYATPPPPRYVFHMILLYFLPYAKMIWDVKSRRRYLICWYYAAMSICRDIIYVIRSEDISSWYDAYFLAAAYVFPYKDMPFPRAFRRLLWYDAAAAARFRAILRAAFFRRAVIIILFTRWACRFSALPSRYYFSSSFFLIFSRYKILPFDTLHFHKICARYLFPYSFLRFFIIIRQPPCACARNKSIYAKRYYDMIYDI